MDDSCAVCAETLEWVAYGACAHRDVCSTCVARLRFICDDRRCCICKTESNVVFVTKALGDYTRVISDFSVLPSELREGKVGSYWYHEDTQAFFDDLDHYKMVKEMCRLSCSECDKTDEQSNDGPKRRGKFRNIEQLKGHLFHRHRLLMCNLCLEGRKVFICEQKLYTRAQLNQHIHTGDSEVDGTESERGGFMGHPMCEFCRTPFYGDNELYSHMSTEHYTCHICQRQHPGQFEYYKNYDDLEIHFRRDHFLCEDEACLGKKFIVFQSEAEMKRHNAIEHGGRMSRSQRSAALQIPTSFRYSRVSEQDLRRGRGRTFRRDRDSSGDQMSMAIQASLDMANASSTFRDPSPSSSNAQVLSDRGSVNDVDPIIQPFDALSTADSEQSSKYLQAASHNSVNMALGESAFPPLPVAPSSGKQKLRSNSNGLPSTTDTMAAKLRPKPKGKVTVIINPPRASNASSRGPFPAPSSFTQSGPISGPAPVLPSNSALIKLTSNNESSTSSFGSSKPSWPAVSNGSSSSNHTSSTQAWPAIGQGVVSASSSSLLKKPSSTRKIIHSASAPNLAENKLFDASLSDFPPVSAIQVHKSPPTSQPPAKVEDVHTANKVLVEKMRAALEFDEDKYAVFKEISGQFRVGLIGAEEYLAYVEQFGLSHLVLDLARLCPDAQKQRELIEIHNANMRRDPLEKDWGSSNSRLKDGSSSRKGKGKLVDNKEVNSKSSLADSIISSVRDLQSSYKPLEVEEVEVLSKEGYRAKGKSKVSVDQEVAKLKSANQQPAKTTGQYDTQSTAAAGSNQNSGDGGGGSKQRKKTSKFHRTRLGDDSAEAFLNLNNADSGLDSDPAEDGNKLAAQPVRSVWGNGGTRKLFAAPNNARK